MAGEFKNPEAAVYLDRPQKACAQRQQRPELHCSEVSVNDDMARSLGGPHQLFEVISERVTAMLFAPMAFAICIAATPIEELAAVMTTC